MGYASKRINHDPEPMVYPFMGNRAEYADESRGWRFSPRPEYDNNYNPILVAFRESGMTADEYTRHCLVNGYPSVFHFEIEHARKVLSRLATFKMSQPEGKA